MTRFWETFSTLLSHILVQQAAEKAARMVVTCVFASLGLGRPPQRAGMRPLALSPAGDGRVHGAARQPHAASPWTTQGSDFYREKPISHLHQRFKVQSSRHIHTIFVTWPHAPYGFTDSTDAIPRIAIHGCRL